MLAWKIRAGSWNGVRLDGMKVVAAVYAGENLGAYPTTARQSILYVDSKATAEQKAALVAAFATQYKSMVGAVREVKSTPIDFAMALDGASVRVGGDLLALDAQKVVQVQVFFDGVFSNDPTRAGGATKRLVHPDLAQDEELAYTPFIPLTSYSLGRAMMFENSDTTLNLTWKDARPRMSVFTGTFAF